MCDAQNFHHNNAGQPQIKIQTSSTKIKAQAVASSAPMLQIFKFYTFSRMTAYASTKNFLEDADHSVYHFQKPSSALTP